MEGVLCFFLWFFFYVFFCCFVFVIDSIKLNDEFTFD